ncbi:hypothetical protein B7494_g5262 [Chlorociboria aeruginascens]|nr:hypothetical protein B7494_g5262 [Chlorociboria aeruginascens]
MGRDLHIEMVSAALGLAKTGRIAKKTQRKLSEIFTMFFTPHHQPERRRGKRSRSEVDKTYRFSKARKVYQKAFQHGACYFIAFVLCVTATDCRDPEIALFPEQDEHANEIQFFLHKDTLALFWSWARFNGYDTNVDFVAFMEKVPKSHVESRKTLDITPEGNIEYEEDMTNERNIERGQNIVTSSEIGNNSSIDQRPPTHDFEVVARIIRRRGLSEDPKIRQAMAILFPEEVPRIYFMKWGLGVMAPMDNW